MANEIRAGRAYVELFTKNNLLVKGLKEAEAKLKAFGGAIQSIGLKFAALGAAIWAPLLGAAKAFADSGSELFLMSQRTGIAVEALSALKFAAEEAGVSGEDLETGLKKMAKTVQQAADGSRQAQASLASLGLTVADLNKLSPDQQFERMAEGLLKIQNPTSRAARALEIFGKNGVALLPLLNRGADGIRAFREEAEKLGLIKTKESAEDAFKLNQAFKLATKAVGSLVGAVGGQLAPLLTDAAHFALSFVGTVRAWIKENKALFVTLAAVGGALTGIGAALLALGGAFKLAAMAIAPISAILSLVLSTVGFILSPLGLVLAAIAGGAALFFTFTDAGQKAFGSIKDGLATLAGDFSSTWSGISDAISAGDWKGAFEIAIAGLKVLWNDFTSFFTEAWHSAVDGIAVILQTLTGKFDNLTRAWEQITGKTDAELNKVQADAEKRNQVFAKLEQFRAQNPGAPIPESLQGELASVGLGRGYRASNSSVAPDPGDISVQSALEREQRRKERENDRKRLDELTAQARQKAQDKRDWDRVTGGMMGPGGIAAALDESRAKTDVKGTFNAYAVGGLGASSVTEDLLRKIADNTRPARQPQVQVNV